MFHTEGAGAETHATSLQDGDNLAQPDGDYSLLDLYEYALIFISVSVYLISGGTGGHWSSSSYPNTDFSFLFSFPFL